MQLLVAHKQDASKQARVLLAFSCINGVFFYVGFNHEQGFHRPSYRQAFALAFGKIMGSLVFAHDFSVGNGVAVFLSKKSEFRFFVGKVRRSSFVGFKS